jgi:PTS system mannose-specific IIB component/fructoselysine and glucoselysine-specific PTS system IIB component
MPLLLYRIDDRLIHGQVVVGWGRPLGIQFIVLVDDGVRASDWEQDLYRMGVPPGVDVVFASLEEGVHLLAGWQHDPRPGLLLTADLETMTGLQRGAGTLGRINLGGIHHKPGRSERLPYIYLTDDELAQARQLAESGAVVEAQDVPTAPAVPVGSLR